MDRRTLLSAIALAPVARSAAAQTKLPVVASFSILADMVREVGGEAVAVVSLVGVDADAHSFTPRPSDVRTLSGARVLVRNGLGFEPWLDRLARSANFRGTSIVASTGVRAREMPAGHAHGHGQGHGHSHERDPHAWQDPRNGLLYARAIAEGLARADAPRAAAYRAGADAYAARLRETDAWIEGRFAPIPRERRRVITSHDAFGYYGARYGIEFRAIQGVSTEGEPSAQAIAALVRQMRAHGIRAVFAENMTNPAVVQALAREAGAVVGGTVFSDALSGPDGPAPDYIAMLRHNTEAFASAFAAAG